MAVLPVAASSVRSGTQHLKQYRINNRWQYVQQLSTSNRVSDQQQLAAHTPAEDKLLIKGTGRANTSGVRTRM